MNLPQSPELASGAGFTFENLIAARYLAALLTEQVMPGAGGVVTAVALQQRDFGEPLDDVIVDVRTASGAPARLSLQCKATLVISDATTNTDFREIIRDSVGTLHKKDFREDKDRYGAATRSVAKGTSDTLTKLCELARDSDSYDHFAQRFVAGGNASAEQRDMKAVIGTLVAEVTGADFSEQFLYRFLRHFVLIQFDYLHEGAVDSAEAVNSVRPALRETDAASAGALWALLCEVAREGAGRSAQFLRPGLVMRLDRSIPLAAAASLRGDLAKLTALAKDWVADIDDDVRGARLARDKLAAQLANLLTTDRFIQLRGLPGSGKSVLLRQSVEASLKVGSVLFLKSDRLEGKSWKSFAQMMGLSGADLVPLLVELGTVGTPVLYVDGIDRVEKEHQGVVADVVRAILTDPLLANWRIVISLRDAGSEPVRTWLPNLFENGVLCTVDVGALDDDEAGALAEARPELATVLFAKGAVQEIVRRPFFAKVLSQAFAGSGAGGSFAPASEVDLIEIWWSRGGFNASGSGATARQRAIVELARLRVRNLSQPLLLADMTNPTVTALDELVADGVLQIVRAGHSVRFSHDIFFEWALYHLFVDRGAAWTDELRAAGEPPVIGRVVELLSEADFAADRQWEDTLLALEKSGLRSQWTRAWLLGPISSASFAANRDRYMTVCAKDDYRWLQKALVWFQAEKTIPNPAILDGRLGSEDLERHEIVRLADLLGWPSDYRAWGRLIQLLLDNIAAIPLLLAPDIVVLFEAWENALRGHRNAVSFKILEQTAAWLSEIEKHRHRPHRFQGADVPSRWDGFPYSLEDLEGSLQSILLRAAATRSDLVTAYLNELLADEYRMDQVFKGVARFSPILARTHATQLTDISLLHFREELPRARHDRLYAEDVARNTRRAAARAKPEAERTDEDDMVLGGPFSILGSSYSHMDWENLAVDKDIGEYFPASPLREPFNSLFEFAPAEGLRLLKELSNHAMTAWCQLHQLDPQHRGTPIPLEMEFPWGKQQFWGMGREYLWARGIWAPKPLSGAYLALESWALKELASGRSADAIIEDVLRGNECIAAVAVAVAVAIKSQAVSETTLPLFTTQRLWRYDLQRKVQEGSLAGSSMIGFHRPGDRAHALAVKAQNELPFRNSWIRKYIPLFLIGAGDNLTSVARARIESFATDLPFEYEEQKAIPQFVAELTEEGRFNAEFGKTDNVKVATVEGKEDQAYVYIDNPLARDPRTQERLAENTERQQEQLLWFWANQSLEGDTLNAHITPETALERAKKIDHAKLFKEQRRQGEFELGMQAAAVAGVAAVVIKYPATFEPADAKWARKVIERAAVMPEVVGDMWSNVSVIPWHPAISAARALGYDIRAGQGGAKAGKVLLSLVMHPLEIVSLTALEICFGLWDIDQRLGWCAFAAALGMSQISIAPMEDHYSRFDPERISAGNTKRGDFAAKAYGKAGNWPQLPAMPSAWKDLGAAARNRYARPDIEFEWGYGSKAVAKVPVKAMVATTQTRAPFLAFLKDALQWIIAKMNPPWEKKSRRDHLHDVGEFDDAIAHLFAKAAPLLTTAELEQAFLTPVLALDDEACYELLAPFVSMYVCAAIFDAATVPENAIDVLKICLGRVLRDPAFAPRGYRDGEMHGHRLPNMVRALLFVSARAQGAARFANGNWTEIATILPIVDPLVRTAGFSASVMREFLTLVERSRDTYPAEMFADQILAVLGSGRSALKGWRRDIIPARIAGLVQSLAYRETPMPLGLAQKLLRILDILVDMGDRRSAALQISDSFREVRLDAGAK